MIISRGWWPIHTAVYIAKSLKKKTALVGWKNETSSVAFLVNFSNVYEYHPVMQQCSHGHTYQSERRCVITTVAPGLQARAVSEKNVAKSSTYDSTPTETAAS